MKASGKIAKYHPSIEPLECFSRDSFYSTHDNRHHTLVAFSSSPCSRTVAVEGTVACAAVRGCQRHWLQLVTAQAAVVAKEAASGLLAAVRLADAEMHAGKARL